MVHEQLRTGDWQFGVHGWWCGLCECHLPSRTEVSKTEKDELPGDPGEPVPHLAVGMFQTVST